MRERAMVVSVDGDEGGKKSGIKVVPLISDACINCDKSMCAKRGKPFSVSNPKNLPVKRGDVVKIASPMLHQVLQALFALALPVLLGVLGYVLVPGSEGLKAVAVTLCFVAGAAVVFVVTHFLPPLKSEIADLLPF